MERDDDVKQRFQVLIRLVLDAHGWTKADLGRALDRHPDRIVPEKGGVKLPLVARLAGLLEWPVGEVAEFLCPGAREPEAEAAAEEFREADTATFHAYQSGDFWRMLRLAHHELSIARTPDERAFARNRLCGAWDSLGYYERSLAVARAAVADRDPIRTSTRACLVANLANAHLVLGHHDEAAAIARELLLTFDGPAAATDEARIPLAIAHLVLGRAELELCQRERGRAGRAIEELTIARDGHLELAARFGDRSYAGVANTAAGALLVAQVEADDISPGQALDALARGLDDLVDEETWPSGDVLESYGWWCAYGCAIAARHLGHDEAQQWMAIFSGRANDIAMRLGNWALHERVLRIEAERRAAVEGVAHSPIQWPITREQARIISGVMSRFREFWTTGIAMLQSSTVVPEH